MELYKGLPLRTITAENKEGVECIFGVTTDNVDYLINHHYYHATNIDEVIEEFHNSYSYGVPQHIFEDEDDNIVIKYINGNIDGNFKIN